MYPSALPSHNAHRNTYSNYKHSVSLIPFPSNCFLLQREISQSVTFSNTIHTQYTNKIKIFTTLKDGILSNQRSIPRQTKIRRTSSTPILFPY
mmetsp:Transcript_5387/g.5905  ORF Transcript_5387/g.5905 Transcript_5387/m.5905 type:complete len:93 (-) Transcript_5387:494-772(-)